MPDCLIIEIPFKELEGTLNQGMSCPRIEKLKIQMKLVFVTGDNESFLLPGKQLDAFLSKGDDYWGILIQWNDLKHLLKYDSYSKIYGKIEIEYAGNCKTIDLSQCNVERTDREDGPLRVMVSINPNLSE